MNEILVFTNDIFLKENELSRYLTIISISLLSLSIVIIIIFIIFIFITKLRYLNEKNLSLIEKIKSISFSQEKDEKNESVAFI